MVHSSTQRVAMSKGSKSPSLVVGSREWVESFPDGMYDAAREITLQSVEQVERLDPINRKLIWDDGKQLSVDESVQATRNYRSSRSIHILSAGLRWASFLVIFPRTK